jgi:hypothetical protein
MERYPSGAPAGNIRPCRFGRMAIRRFKIAQAALEPIQVEQIDGRSEANDVLLVFLTAQQRGQAELLKFGEWVTP